MNGGGWGGIGRRFEGFDYCFDGAEPQGSNRTIGVQYEAGGTVGIQRSCEKGSLEVRGNGGIQECKALSLQGTSEHEQRKALAAGTDWNGVYRMVFDAEVSRGRIKAHSFAVEEVG